MWTCAVALVRKAPGAAETVVAPVSCGLDLPERHTIDHTVTEQTVDSGIVASVVWTATTKKQVVADKEQSRERRSCRTHC